MAKFLTALMSAVLISAEPAITAAQESNEPVATFLPGIGDWTFHNDKDNAAEHRTVGDGKQRVLQIIDDDGDGPEDFYAYRVLSDDEREVARDTGFVLNWRVRIPDETRGPTRAVSTEVCIARRDGSGRLRFGVQMGRWKNGFTAQIHSGSRGAVDGSLGVDDPDAFHDWSLLFEPKTKTVNVTVDGRAILSTFMEHDDQGHHLVFGSRSTGTGNSEWGRVQFFIGLPADRKIVPPPDPPNLVDVFVGGEDDYFAYRIPSLLRTPKGTLLAICEGRKSSLADLGNNDLVLKRSKDNGQTWSPMEIVYDEGDKVTIGNPTPVIDSSTGTIRLVFGRDARNVLVMTSRDDGRTWSKPVDITSQVTRPEWKFYGVGPGVGIQLRHGPHAGRLIIPAYHRTTQDKSGPTIAHVFFSDDGGESWQASRDVGIHMCENQIVETVGSNGPEILLNARNHWARSGGRPDLAGKRIISRSRDGGMTWSDPEFDETLIEPTCQASLFRYSEKDGENPGRILFANPASTSRSRITVRMSMDEGRTWPVQRLIDPGRGAYSSLAVLKDKQIGVLYESGSYKRITFASFDLNWLTTGNLK